MKVNYWQVNQKIYFLNDLENINSWTEDKKFHDLLNEMNETNTSLYINGKNYIFQKFFYPEKEGTYAIKIVFHFPIKDCSYYVL